MTRLSGQLRTECSCAWKVPGPAKWLPFSEEPCYSMPCVCLSGNVHMFKVVGLRPLRQNSAQAVHPPSGVSFFLVWEASCKVMRPAPPKSQSPSPPTLAPAAWLVPVMEILVGQSMREAAGWLLEGWGVFCPGKSIAQPLGAFLQGYSGSAEKSDV